MAGDLAGEKLAQLERSLLEHFMPGYAAQDPETLKRELFIHTIHRLTEHRNNVIPWLAEHMSLSGARVLEIGAGTGASIVALAEVSRQVDGIDIEESHLRVAADRVALHGLHNVRLLVRNALDLEDLYAEPYDLIVFSATLEHMTYQERIATLRAAWDNLPAGGHLCIYETPNRLWYRDDHTSLMPFFHWLPDDLAMDYAVKSSRSDFAEALAGRDPVTLARWGRGASFHEIDLAIGLDAVEVRQSQHEFLCARHPHYRQAWEASPGKRYAALLAEIAPAVPGPFLEELLSLLLRKPGAD
ncbi:SAM-dependent methyltransferase [Siccirubricoccus phaeus]|uniref:SAM-dependent methyltransferase n=1 Tax=Siccirubricoccus phaeus TaxID=2595053 RepID=UPI00165C03C6|nr:class I SAM-dependent methyltransferase [Siccirubricoccus phaeus]